MTTTYWLNSIMDTMYKDNSGSFYIGLSSTLPTASGTNVTEPSGNAYQRVPIGTLSAAANGVVKNSNAIQFPKSTGTWFSSSNKAKYWLLFDGNTISANLLSWGELSTQRTIEGDTTVTISANSISFTLTDSNS